MVGWLSREEGGLYTEAYLLPAAAYGVVRELARRQGQDFPVDPRTLSRRLKELGLLLATEGSNNSVKRTIEGGKQRVWVVAPGRLVEAADGAGARPGGAALPVPPPTADELAALTDYEEGVV
jgi:hypothetical protein